MKFDILTTNTQQKISIGKISKKMAYHQAGYAAAIHIGNQHKQLPTVHFHVAIKPELQNRQPNSCMTGIIEDIFCKCAVNLEGGRLIQPLPLRISEAVQNLSWYQQAEYCCALESDVVNLLAGPLAEAKYVALRDNEVFKANLLNINSLHFYNGSSAIELANKYMECYLPNEEERERKLAQLLMLAFNFVADHGNWRKIRALAEFIQSQTKAGVIPSKELISLLDSGLPLSRTDSLNLQSMELCG